MAFFSVLIFAMTGFALRGQDATGRIIGNVTDPSNAPILGAQVNVANTGTKIAWTTSTDATGFYQVLSLPIGEYEVTIEATGFRKQVFEHQRLQINQSLRLDAKLSIGQASESVEVTSQAANVETVNQTIGASVIGETIQRAPLNGRNVLDLAALQPGVTETNGDSTAAGSYSIAGGRSDSVTYLLDGGLNNNLLDNSVVLNPNPDTIAEFRILESNYTAEYGRNSGGIISVVTKSGTNEWHGSAFEFLRNDAFNANTFFNKVDGLPRDVLKRNQYGATLGGPIRKDKFFFFVGYQGQRLSSQQTTGSQTVFTTAQLQNGDFSGDPNVEAFLQQNPYFAANGCAAPCAVIDPSKFNPVAKAYIAAGLIPSTPNPSGVASYQSAHTNNNNELTMKFDFVLSEKDKLTVTIGGFRNPQLNPFVYATAPGFPDGTQVNDYYLNGAYSRSFTANLINEFRAFTQRSFRSQDNPVGEFPSPASLGMTGITPDNPIGPPILTFDNGAFWGLSYQGPTVLANNTFGLSDTVTYVHGRNTWKMGGGVSAYQNNTLYDYFVDGQFTFDATDSTGAIYGAGNSLANFLLGIPYSYTESPAAPSNIRSKSYYGFVQDEWRLTRRFTLTLGLRYEYSSPKEDTKGRSFSIIPGVTTPSTVFPNAPIGMLFPGDPGAPVGVNFPDKKNWAPRFGFAWDPLGDGKTSVRGGIGIFYDILKAEDNLQFNGQSPFFANAGIYDFPVVGPGQTGNLSYMADPFTTTGTPNPFPSKPPASNVNFASEGFLPINSSGSVYLVDPHLKTPYTYQYSLSVQREVAPSTVLEVSYVGSSSHGLTSLVDINPFVLGTTDRILNLVPGNSSCQDASGDSTSGVTDPSQLCSYLNLPEFKNVANANYNSLQASLTRQMADSHYFGRTYFTLAYTLAHSIDDASGFQQRNSAVPYYDPQLFRASSDQDVRHRITFSGGWDLPIDRMLSSAPKRLTQGWSLFPIVTWHSGFPFDVFAIPFADTNPYSEGPSGAGDDQLVHANVTGSLAQLNPRTTQTFTNPNATSPMPSTGNYWFNPSSLSTAFPADSQVVANPSLSTYGTLPRNFLRGPGFINFDLAFAKTTAITERVKLEFRAEFFNIFNHANFLNPGVTNNGDGTFSGYGVGTDTTSSQFGQITSTYDPRIIQLALRLSF
jgi:outer membrane receptor protein involved in Fe transport